MPRDEFISLLSQTKALIQTHHESYGAAIREALFLGCRVYVQPQYVEPAVLRLEGVVPFTDPQELPALLTKPLPPFVSTLMSIEGVAREIAERLRRAT